MIYINILFLLFYLSIIIATMITIIMDNRQPTKTMAWILVLVFLPIVGFVLYIFFGQNIRKERFISQRSLDKLSKQTMFEYIEQQNLRLPLAHSALIQFFQSQNMAFPFKDNEAEIYTSGHDFILSLLKEIGSAQHHIHLVSYIFEDDELGYLIADALIDKARQGVEVRLIYDDVGCWKVKNKFWQRIRNGGVEVYAFMPVHFPAFTSKMNYRNHRKLCVVDGKTAFIGGMNIALHYLKGTKKMQWRDTHLKVVGGAVYGIQRAFLIDWYFVSQTLLTSSVYYPPLSNGISNECIAQVVTGSPVSVWPDIMQGFIRIILEAKHYVYIETPYFLPTEPFMAAITNAALSGVDVRLLIPAQSDVLITSLATHSYIPEALEAGVKVFLYQKGFNHSKLLVCDDSLCTCGSTNIDFRSFENNFESNIIFYDPKMAKRMKEIFIEDENNSILVVDYIANKKRSFAVRLWESILRLLSPLL